MDLIVTSGGLGPTADDLTAEVVARFAGRELVLDEEIEEKIAEILRGFAKRFNFDEEAVREANRKQAMVPEGATPLDPVGTAPGLVVPAGEQVVVVLPGPPRELQPMWPAALETDRVRERARAGDAAARLHAADVRHPRVRDRQEPARDRGGGRRAARGRDHHLPAPRRDRDRRPLPRRGGGRPPRRCAQGSPSAIRAQLFSDDGETIDAQVAAPARRAPARARRVLQRRACWRRGSPTCPAPPPTMAGSVVAYSNEAKAELLGVDPA